LINMSLAILDRPYAVRSLGLLIRSS